MQQGDCNAPATFMKIMNWILAQQIVRDVYVYLDISKNDLWLTLLTRLIWITPAYNWLPGHLQKRFLAYLAYMAYILLPAPLKPSQFWFRALSHLARYACDFPHPNSTNLVTLVHLRLSSTGTHKLICISGIQFPCVIETRPSGALRKPVSLLQVVC